LIHVASRGPCMLRRRDEERMEVVACDLQTGNRKPYALTYSRWPPRHQTVSLHHLTSGGGSVALAWATVSDPYIALPGGRSRQQLAFDCSSVPLSRFLPRGSHACLFVFALLPETLTTASILGLASTLAAPQPLSP
jgi:hypothetical protein